MRENGEGTDISGYMTVRGFGGKYMLPISSAQSSAKD